MFEKWNNEQFSETFSDIQILDDLLLILLIIEEKKLSKFFTSTVLLDLTNFTFNQLRNYQRKI